MTNAEQQKDIKAGGLWGAIVLLLGGLGVATYQTLIKLRLQNDPTYKSSCNQGDAFNCDAVMTSPWSEIAGLPISLFAIPTYAVMIYLAYRGLSGVIQPGKMWARTRGITSIAYLVLIGLLSCVYSGYLFYVSAFELDTFCIYCVALYTVNLGATGLAVWSAPVGFGDLLKDGMSRVFRIQEPMVSSALVFLVAVGLSYTVYQDKLGEMSGSRFDEIDDLFADEEYEEEGEVEEVVAEAPAAPAPTAKPGTASAPAPVKKVRSTRKGKKPKPKMTENGLSFSSRTCTPMTGRKGQRMLQSPS